MPETDDRVRTPSLTPRARLVLRHLATSHAWVPVGDLLRFSPADGSIVDAKHEARENATALTELVRQGVVTLWVSDLWTPEAKAAPVAVCVLALPRDAAIELVNRAE